MKPSLLLTIVPLALVAGCASPPPSVDSQVRNQLLTNVAQLKAAAARKDRPGAETTLQALTSEVAAAEAEGKLDGAHAQPILAAADRVAADVRTLNPPAPTIVTVPIPETTQPPRQDTRESQDNKGSNHKHGKG
jgi:outer membrane murein-binding lipoprotein Lpp